MSKWVEVEVRMYRRFLVEVPDEVAFPEQWADAEVYNFALTNKEQAAVTDIEAYLAEENEYIEKQKRFYEVIKLVKE